MNVIELGSTDVRSDDITVGDGLLTVFLVGEDSGLAPRGAIVHVDFKSDTGVYMTQETLTRSKPSWTLQAAPGTVVSLRRLATGVAVGVDAVGVAGPGV